MSKLFNNITPEQAGIPSEAVTNLLNQLEQNEVNIHGFCLMRGDNIFAEGYWKPFHREYQHRMYSVGKSFTSIAIGLLQSDGLLNINDPICNYFQDKLSNIQVHPYIAEMTIRDMLMMTTAHRSTTFRRYSKDDWVESFFAVKPTHHPGALFSYDTSSAHVLSALVEKLSGKSLMDYLRYKFMELEFSKQAKFIPDKMGISQGGSGLVCSLEDLYKLAYVCMNNGKFKDTQLIPAEYLKEATSNQIDTSSQPVIDEQQGYGYQIWKSQHDGFALYGIGGQLAVCFPEYQIVFATTADTLSNPTGVQCIYEAFWQQIFPYVTKSLKPDNKGWKTLPDAPIQYALLQNRLDSLKIIPMVKGAVTSPYTEFVSGKKYVLEENLMGIEYFTILFQNEKCTAEYKNRSGIYTIPFRLGDINHFRLSENYPDMLSSAAWVSEHILILQVNLIGDILGNARIQLAFKGNFVTIFMKQTAEAILLDYDGTAVGETI